MNYFKEVLDYLTKIFQWWVIISPWEKAIRVRFGKHTKILDGGTHFRIPFFDIVYVQCFRMRVVQMPVQTISTKDGHTLSVVICGGYSIKNIEKLYNRMAMPEGTISNMIMGEASQYIYSHNLTECNPELLEAKILERLNLDDFGIKYEYVKVLGYAVVKTFRLIQDQSWMPNALDVNTARQ